MSLEANAQSIFAAHQTFHPRFGWLKKGFDAVEKDPTVFSREDAPVVLGVGKNMVEAIRFWSQAFKVIAPEKKVGKGRSSTYTTTDFGRVFLGDDGIDPYLEDSTSLWILHWMLCSPVSQVPVWWLAMNEFTPVEFTDDSLQEFIKEKVDASIWKTPSSSTLKKDVDAFLRMYLRREARGRQTIDDLLDSPFRELGLISDSAAHHGHYRLNNGKKASLTSTAVAFAALDFLASVDADARTMSFTRLAYETNSVGKVFRLPLDVLATLLEEAASDDLGLSIANPGGVQQLVLADRPEVVARNILASHFGVSKRALTTLNPLSPGLGQLALPEPALFEAV